MKERGYTNIDALDASRGMLEQAKAKNIYKNYIHAWLGAKPIEGIANSMFENIKPLSLIPFLSFYLYLYLSIFVSSLYILKLENVSEILV